MHKVDNENPNEMYDQAKNLLKKYYGNYSITNNTKLTVTPSVQLMPAQPEPFFISVNEYNKCCMETTSIQLQKRQIKIINVIVVHEIVVTNRV